MMDIAGDVETALTRLHSRVPGGSDRFILAVFALFRQEELSEPESFESAGGFFVIRRSQSAERGGRRAGGDNQLLWENDFFVHFTRNDFFVHSIQFAK